MNIICSITSTRGYAAITTTLLMLVVSLTVVSAFTFFALQEAKTNRAYTKSIHARYVAESGIEDAAYRIIAQKQIGASQLLGVGDGITTVTITTSGNTRTIRSEGVRDAFQRNLETVVDVSATGVSFNYGVQVGDGGLLMKNNSKVNGNIYSNGGITGASGATITGDAIVAGGITMLPQVQWTSDTANQYFADSSASRDIAQSFTASATGPIPQVSVLLSKVGSPSGNITLRVTTDNGGKPNTTDIANTVIANSSVASSIGWIDVVFASPPNVTMGTTYWIVLDYGSNSTANYWNWRKDDTDAYPLNTGKYADDWSSPGATWVNANGDLAFKVWIGNIPTQIANVTVGDATSGLGRANLFVNDTIHGSSCPNAYCIVENPARQALPIPAGVIQNWKNAAQAGGVCAPPVCDSSGNLNVSGTTTVGPLKIPGNVTVNTGATLIVSGTLWVQGDINFGSGCHVNLSASYGALSGVVVTDGTVDVSNNCAFAGSGAPGSSIMILSDKNDPTDHVMEISNNSNGVIYYATHGRVHMKNNTSAKEITAYGLDLDNNATVTYDSGLANTQFSSGPSGGYDIKRWHEVQ